MKKFKVRACWKSHYHAIVEAEDGYEANKKAVMEMSQEDFTDEQSGEWEVEIDEPAEEIKRGYWDDEPDYPAEDWRTEVFNGDTRQSYSEWVESQREAADED